MTPIRQTNKTENNQVEIGELSRKFLLTSLVHLMMFSVCVPLDEFIIKFSP